MRHYLKGLVPAVLAAALASFASWSVAGHPDIGCGSLMHSGTSNGITVNECPGDYQVINNSDQAIHAFAVSSQLPGGAGFSFTSRFGWSSLTMSEGMWNLFFGAGSFDASFNAQDDAAFLYFLSPGDSFPQPPTILDFNPQVFVLLDDGEPEPRPIMVGETTPFEFHFLSGPRSSFVAFGAGGFSSPPLGAAHLTLVPEPQAYVLALGGLAVLGWVAARRRTAHSVGPAAA